MKHNRKEPVFEEALEENEDAPLLLTNMIREGLPPPLWRHEEPMESAKSPSKSSEDHLDKKVFPTERAFSAQWEEAQTPSTLAMNTAATPQHAQSGAYLQDAETPSASKVQKDFEDNDLEAALARMREGLGQFTASRNETPSDEKITSAREAPVSGIVSDRLKPAPDPIATEPEKKPVESALPELDSPVQEPVEVPHATEHDAQEPVLEKPASDLDFLKDFEQLLFQEIERRVMNELEEKMIQHLQTVWKEQVSLTMMRTLALEGIKLRESVAQEMRQALPEILQRVLHDGLEQIIPNEAD
ncbi:hypothetical protein ACJU26_11195 [Acidithiobacillus sp. M4-SHS-6]|uniref:hypothetical protein n=1 Tax=Acidithiobacillus sp. M4-SHS-6 TaxID=3383024 RepID=UPI0039BE05C1